MTDSIIKKIVMGAIEEAEDLNSLLRDDEGNYYEVSEQYYKDAIERVNPSVDKEIDLKLANELLRSELKYLTTKQKDVIYYMVVGMSITDIAVKMNLNRSTVYKHLNAAKKKLSKLIINSRSALKEGLING